MIFASMPYVSLERPSVALGTLAAALERDGISCHTVYANLLFAERIGVIAYEWFNNTDITLQIGEWTFSEAAFPNRVRSVDEFMVALYGDKPVEPHFRDSLLRMRALACEYIDEVAREIVSLRPRIVGCSSVFQQHCASLALLRRVRELDPNIVTMLGGANCEASMGVVTHRAYPWVDFVVSGEADKLLPDLCRIVFERGRDVPVDLLPFGVLGPASRSANGSAPAAAPRAIINNLDEIPIPIFDDYFEQLERSTLRDWILPCIPIETSRGCWWGAKHHCTFCGLNGEGMTFRAKSEDRVLSEVGILAEKHGLRKFMTVDNILDNRYFGRVLPAMAERGDMRVFYETKANLSRAQVEMLSRAGVRWIQPGIEALNDDLLTLLRKGCSVAVNVQLLKWARTYGVWVIWNHLFAAPGDRPEWYEKTADLIPLIVHLQPPAPGGMTPIRYDRFSPYFNDADAYGLKLVPYPAYAHAYPLDERQLMDQAYFFCDDSPRGPAPKRLVGLIEAWAKWFYGDEASLGKLPRRSDSAPELSMAVDGARIVIRDTRPCAVAAEHELDLLESRVYRATDAARGLRAIGDAVRAAGATESDDAIAAALQRLVHRKLIADFDGKYLALAVDADALPYLEFNEFAGGLALLGGPQKAKNVTVADPWETPLREMF
ncbi:MAG TPA: RiPP maturation radical SAM C-methyltransferase [Thermoanaerobaculia bacterium]|nr:RiPP maturation radical SAM C-methyltransferase [Thermoanaerobaculia bacterium]